MYSLRIQDCLLREKTLMVSVVINQFGERGAGGGTRSYTCVLCPFSSRGSMHIKTKWKSISLLASVPDVCSDSVSE